MEIILQYNNGEEIKAYRLARELMYRYNIDVLAERIKSKDEYDQKEPKRKSEFPEEKRKNEKNQKNSKGRWLGL